MPGEDKTRREEEETGRGDLVFAALRAARGPWRVPGTTFRLVIARDLENPKPQPSKVRPKRDIADCTRAIVASLDAFQHAVIAVSQADSAMAWQTPQSVVRALRGIQFRQLSELSQRNQQCSRISRLLTSQTSQRRDFSNSASKPAAPAAPPIDFSQPGIIPARILPASPAYFTGSPKYTDQLLRLENLLAKYAMLPTVNPADAPRMAWLKLTQFRNLIGEPVPTSRYKRVVKILLRLNRIDRNVMPAEVMEAMEMYLRPGNPYQQKASPVTIDEMGRARGVGRRKTSSAQVWLVEGDGEVIVNGRSIVDIFPRLHDRESALWALRSTGRLDKYNVFALAKGGGVTGQAEAITVALARALLVHEPALKPVLRRGTSGAEIPMIPHLLRPWSLGFAMLTSHYSWCRHHGPQTGREKEAWPHESQKEARLGPQIKRPIHIYLLFLFSLCRFYISLIFSQYCIS